MSNIETLTAKLTTARAALAAAEESETTLQQAEDAARASLQDAIEQGVNARSVRAQAVEAVEAIESEISALNAN